MEQDIDITDYYQKVVTYRVKDFLNAYIGKHGKKPDFAKPSNLSDPELHALLVEITDIVANTFPLGMEVRQESRAENVIGSYIDSIRSGDPI
ncbi:MAG: hypothetical protein KDD76_00865, partial [Rickettsiales bacterium]|nr:hypothetical protein [Rickettsiales bacterium]